MAASSSTAALQSQCDTAAQQLGQVSNPRGSSTCSLRKAGRPEEARHTVESCM